jgi:hypothetical protein
MTIEMQPRDKQGFILKTGPDGLTYSYDPGKIDRWLWTQANPSDDSE